MPQVGAGCLSPTVPVFLQAERYAHEKWNGHGSPVKEKGVRHLFPPPLALDGDVHGREDAHAPHAQKGWHGSFHAADVRAAESYGALTA